MSDPRPLLTVSTDGALLLLEADAKATAEAAWGWRDAGLTVRTARGRKMRTVQGLFDELAAALQFPHYFGENWPAFSECLADMEWLPMSVGIVLLLLEPADVLADSEPSELGVLVRAVGEAYHAYSQPVEAGEWWDRPAVPFHVVLQAATGQTSAVTDRWVAAGASVAPFAR
jgi:hypothetical protein